MFGRKRKRKAQDLVEEAGVSAWLGAVGEGIEARERALTHGSAVQVVEPAVGPRAW